MILIGHVNLYLIELSIIVLLVEEIGCSNLYDNMKCTFRKNIRVV
jgi:hypothetical protein